MLSIYSAVSHNFYGCSLYPFKRPKRIILISFQNLELLLGRSSSPVGYGIGIAEVVGSNPTRSTLIKASLKYRNQTIRFLLYFINWERKITTNLFESNKVVI